MNYKHLPFTKEDRYLQLKSVYLITANRSQNVQQPIDPEYVK